jgi:penicillin amidase
LLSLVAFSLLLVIVAAGWFYHAARTALPQLDGSVQIRGISSRVMVTRDAHGVPTIDADNFEDLFFAQGYVTAQDRLWQMDISRRFAGGEIAEILGPDFVQHDREQRTLLLRARAERAVQETALRERTYLEAYTRGVNAFIETHRKQLPLEFHILRYQPRLWTPVDTLVISANMVKELNHRSVPSALQREKVLAKLGPELTADLYPNTSWRDHPPGMDGSSHNEAAGRSGASVADLSRKAVAAIRQIPTPHSWRGPAPETNSAPGSNAWVLSGAHTASGRPLLSNDPHLGHQMPGLWYEAHLRCPGLDVVGITLPGAPSVVLGHNQRIAWGFTNVGPTVEDLFIENFNAAGQYQTPQGWREPERRHEIIRVRGKSAVEMDVVVTRHGPIISELFPSEKRSIALQWTLYGPAALQSPFVDVDTAQNWKEFRHAFSRWVAPGQNVVYADIDGHIGYQATGRVPIRASGDGSLPVSGSDNAHEWIGYIPFEQLPNVFDPPSGVLATANGRITRDGYPYSISVEWEPPYRTERIYEVLNSKKKFSSSDMLALQTDVYSEFDRFCAQRFAYALDHVKKLSLRARQARDLMREWDGTMGADSAAAAIEVQAQRELYRRLLEPKLGTVTLGQDKHPEDHATLSWKSYNWAMWPLWMENILQRQPKRWLPAGYANFDELLAAAVENVVGARGTPNDLTSWRWGPQWPLEIEHPILGRIPILHRWTGPGLKEQSGNALTVKAVGRHFGPSERTTVNLADFDTSTLNVVTGQSGNFLSPYYMDQWPAWYNGITFLLPFSREAVKAAKTHELLLEPGK